MVTGVNDRPTPDIQQGGGIPPQVQEQQGPTKKDLERAFISAIDNAVTSNQREQYQARKEELMKPPPAGQGLDLPTATQQAAGEFKVPNDKLQTLLRGYNDAVKQVDTATSLDKLQQIKTGFTTTAAQTLPPAVAPQTQVSTDQVSANQNQVEPFNESTFPGTLDQMGEAQGRGTGSFHIYGPVSDDQFIKAQTAAAKHTPPMTVHATTSNGETFFVVQNEAKGEVKHFEMQVDPLHEYKVDIPPLPAVRNDGFMHALGAAGDLSGFCRAILSHLDGKDGSTAAYRPDSTLFMNMWGGDDSLPADQGIKSGAKEGGGMKVEIEWAPRAPDKPGVIEEKPGGPVEEKPPTTHSSTETATYIGDQRQTSVKDQFSTQSTDRSFIGSLMVTDRSAVTAPNHSQAYTDSYHFQNAYQEQAYSDVLLTGKPPSVAEVRQQIKQDVDEMKAEIKERLKTETDPGKRAKLQQSLHELNHSNIAVNQNRNFPGAVEGGVTAGQEDRKFLVQEFKRDFQRQHPDQPLPEGEALTQAVNQYVQEKFVDVAKQKWEATSGPGSWDKLNPAQQMVAIRNEIQTPQVAASVFDQTGQAWNTASSTQRQQMFPGLTPEAYNKPWGQLDPTEQAGAVRVGVLGDPNTSPPTKPCITLSVGASADPSAGTFDAKRGEWRYNKPENTFLAEQRVQAGMADLLDGLSRRGVFDPAKDKQLMGDLQTQPKDRTPEQQQRGLPVIVETPIKVHDEPPGDKSKLPEGTQSGPLNLDEQSATITTKIKIPETTVTQQSDLKVDEGAGQVQVSVTTNGKTRTYAMDREAQTITVQTGDKTVVYDYAKKQTTVTEPGKDPITKPMTDNQATSTFSTMQSLVARLHGNTADNTADNQANGIMDKFKARAQENNIRMDDPELPKLHTGVTKMLEMPSFQKFKAELQDPLKITTEGGFVAVHKKDPPGGAVMIPRVTVEAVAERPVKVN